MTSILDSRRRDGTPPASTPDSLLAIDIGAGTQDILVWSADREPENCPKLVVPSQTQIVAGRIRAATAARAAVHLTGRLMGGGASSEAAKAHLDAGLPLSATPSAAKTLHNDPTRVEAMGVALRFDPPPGAVVIETTDLDLDALAAALASFGIALPATVAVAVQDHGDPRALGEEAEANAPAAAGDDSVHNRVRFAYLQSLLDGGGDLVRAVYQEPPPGMTRMAAVRETVPGAFLMDTGAAAVLGALGDPVVAEAAQGQGAILINLGNMHTFAVLLRGRRLFGLFEHHTGGMTPALIAELVDRLRAGTLNPATFRMEFDGHGAALDPGYREIGPFSFVAVTGPNRRIARSLGYHEAAPHGDMMLTGSYGLVEGVRLALANDR